MPNNTDEKTKSVFVQKLLNAIDITKPITSAKTKLLVTAHAAYESGWGSAKAAREGHNFWNLTAGKSWKGGVVLGNDTEFKEGSSSTAPAKIVQRFRSYASAAAGVQDYFAFLSYPRYKDALSKLVAADETFVVDLGLYKHSVDGKSLVNAWGVNVVKGGFYTLPIEQYSAEFKVVYDKVALAAGICT